MSRSTLTAVALSVAALLVTAGCTPSSGNTQPTGGVQSTPPSFTACLLSDVGGFADNSLSALALSGLMQAVDVLGVGEKYVESPDAKSFADNLNSLVAGGCGIVIGVGAGMADAVVAAATANPSVDFAIVDAAPAKQLANLQPMTFNTKQASFLGGYLAAALTKNAMVGTFGAVNNGDVNSQMSGFAQGVAYFNKQNKASVRLLGWDASSKKGTYLKIAKGADPYNSVDVARAAAQNFVAQGVDVLFPLAGNSGIGALQVAQASNGGVSVIWAGGDGCATTQYCPVIPTTVLKGADQAVYQAVQAASNGSFDPKPYVGGLDNGGVGLARWHLWDADIPDQTKTELGDIQNQIVAGAIMVS